MPRPYRLITDIPDPGSLSKFAQLPFGASNLATFREEFSELMAVAAMVSGVDASALNRDIVSALPLTELRAKLDLVAGYSVDELRAKLEDAPPAG